jgi:hypothetical protein
MPVRARLGTLREGAWEKRDQRTRDSQPCGVERKPRMAECPV